MATEDNGMPTVGAAQGASGAASADAADTMTTTAASTATTTVTAEVGDAEVVGTTAAAAESTYPVAPGYRVNVRSGPTTNSPVVKVLAYNARVRIRCQRRGQNVSGPYGTSDIWDSIAPGQYISDTYVRTGSDGFVTVPCG